MSDSLIESIRSNRIRPYAHMSDAAMSVILGHQLKIVRIAKGDSHSIPTPDGLKYLSIISGDITVVSGDLMHEHRPYNRFSTQRSPLSLFARDGTVVVSARTDAVLAYGDGDVIDDIVSIDTLIADRLAPKEERTRALVMMRASTIFATVSAAALIEIYERMVEVDAEAGADIVTPDTAGQAYCFLLDGRAEVWQESFDDDEPRLAATMGPGEGFGEELLLVDSNEQTTVKMVTPGRYLTLAKDDYLNLVNKQRVERISCADTATRMKDGATLIDVRYDLEVEDEHIPGCLPIPLHFLRERMGDLDKSKPIIVYCRSGRRSLVGALLLKQNGYDSYSMDGGLAAWEGETAAMEY